MTIWLPELEGRKGPRYQRIAAAIPAYQASASIADVVRRTRALFPDVLVVDGDPLADLGALCRPIAVWARGRQAL